MDEEHPSATPPSPTEPAPGAGANPEPEPNGGGPGAEAERLLDMGRAGDAVAALDLAGGDDAVASFVVRRNWDEQSESLLEAALARFPEDDRILSDLAYYYMFRNRHEEALEALARLLAARPENTSAWAAKARILRTLGRHAEAEDALASVPEELRRDPQISGERAELLVERGEPDLAITELEASGGEDAVAAFIQGRGWDERSEALLAAGLARFPENGAVLERGVRYYVEKIRYFSDLEGPPPDDILANAPAALRQNREVAQEYADLLAQHKRHRADYQARLKQGAKERRAFERALAREALRVRGRRVKLALARATGRALVWFADGGGRGLIRMLSLALVIGASVLTGEWAILLVYVLVLLVLSGWRARARVVIQDFTDNTAPAPPPGEEGGGPAPTVGGSAALLAGRLVRLRGLFAAAQERGESSASVGEEGTTELAVALEDIGDLLRGAVAADAQMEVGVLKIPIGSVMALIGGLVQAPRLRGSLRGDTGRFLLSAELSFRGRDFAWRVQRDAPDEAAEAGGEQLTAAREQIIESMVDELAYRVFTDLAVGPEHQWEATEHVAEGLEEFVACLTTPESGKLQLTRVERRLTEALAKDSTFVLAYHNLGVIHMQLANRESPGTPWHNQHMQAAVAAFRRTIQEDPGRWEGRYALASVLLQQADLVGGRVGEGLRRQAVEQCERVLQLRPPRASAALAYNLKSLEERRVGDLQEAIASRREASRLIVGGVAAARLRRGVTPASIQRLRSQAAQCVLNLAVAYAYATEPLADAGDSRAPRRDPVFRNLCVLLDLAILLSDRDAGAHFEYGKIAEMWGQLDVARRELETAARIEPHRPLLWARLAGACATAMDADAARDACGRSEDAQDPSQADEESVETRQILLEVYQRLGEFAAADRLKRMQELENRAKRASEEDADADAIGRVHELVGDWSQSGEHPWETARLAFEVGRLELGRDPDQAGFYLDVALDSLGEGHPAVRRWALHGLRSLAYSYSARRHSEKVADPLHEAENARIAGALREAEMARALDPLSSWVWSVLAEAHEVSQDLEHARNAWQRALLRSPDDAHYHRRLGVCCWALARASGDAGAAVDARQEATEHLHTALELTPGEDLIDRRWSHYVLARLDGDRDRFDDAIPHLLFVYASSDESGAPLRVLTNLLLGEARMQLGDFTAAEEHLSDAIAQGEALLAGGAPAATISTDCGELVQDRLPLGLVLGWAHCMMADSHGRRGGDLDRAAHHVTQAEAYADRVRDELDEHGVADTITATCWAARGRILLREGDLGHAIEALGRSVAIRADSEAYLDLARAHERAARRATGENQRDQARDQAYLAIQSVKQMELDGRVLEAARLVEQRLDIPNGSDGSEADGAGRLRTEGTEPVAG